MTGTTVGELEHVGDGLLITSGDDIGRAETASDLEPVVVVADHDDPLGPDPVGRKCRAEPDGAVADHDGRAPPFDTGADHAVMAGRKDIGERRQFREQGGVAGDFRCNRHERPVGVRHPHGLALTAIGVTAEEAAVHAGRLQAMSTELATAVGEREG